MVKSRYDIIINTLLAIMLGLTFFNLYKNIIWLSYVLAVMFLIFVVLHIRNYKRENMKSKKVFVLMLIVLINFLLANSVIVLAEYIYPYY